MPCSRSVDDKKLFAAENVVPVIKKTKSTPEVERILNAVSAKLTTADLISMNRKAGEGTDAADVAKEWLTTAGLNPA
jgi:osmoprotectant transport system substrate-binding protein